MNERAMTELFDSYRNRYRDVVQSSIDFSGLPHSFFMRAKANLLRELIAQRLGSEKPTLLDVGCGIGTLHPLLSDMVGLLSGIDVSSASIAQARADNRQVRFGARRAGVHRAMRRPCLKGGGLPSSIGRSRMVRDVPRCSLRLGRAPSHVCVSRPARKLTGGLPGPGKSLPGPSSPATIPPEENRQSLACRSCAAPEEIR
jgi:SAM-dependent methyltransferase